MTVAVQILAVLVVASGLGCSSEAGDAGSAGAAGGTDLGAAARDGLFGDGVGGAPSGDGDGDGAGDTSSGDGDGDGDTASGDGDGDSSEPLVPRIPPLPDNCPAIATGNVTIRGQQVRLWVGDRRDDVKGQVFFYWHGTGGGPQEAGNVLGAGIIDEIIGNGGMVASFSTSTGDGLDTGNSVWFTGDFGMADDLFACAVDQLNIDTTRVFTSGCSSGGLQAGAMVSSRSSYLAGSMPNSGGILTAFVEPFEQGGATPAVITNHGPPAIDPSPGAMADGIYTYEEVSLALNESVAARGGFAANCAHSNGHCLWDPQGRAAAWEYLNAHPFAVTPDPYADGLPGDFPSYCKPVENTGAGGPGQATEAQCVASIEGAETDGTLPMGKSAACAACSCSSSDCYAALTDCDETCYKLIDCMQKKCGGDADNRQCAIASCTDFTSAFLAAAPAGDCMQPCVGACL